MSYRFLRRKPKRKLKLSEEWKKSLTELSSQTESDHTSVTESSEDSFCEPRCADSPEYFTLGSQREVRLLLLEKVNALKKKLYVKDMKNEALRKENEKLTTLLEEKDKILSVTGWQLKKAQLQVHYLKELEKQGKEEQIAVKEELHEVIPGPTCSLDCPTVSSDAVSISSNTTTPRSNATGFKGWSPRSTFRKQNLIGKSDNNLSAMYRHHKVGTPKTGMSKHSATTRLFSRRASNYSEDRFQTERIGC